MISPLNSWSTVTLDNYNQKYEQTKKYGHHRLILGLYCSKLLNQLNITWWLDGGNLLGAYRDGRMIAHDTDFDIAVLATQSQFQDLFDRLQEKVDKNFKLRKIQTFCTRIQVYDPHSGQYMLQPHHKFSYHNVTVNIQLYTRHQSSIRIEYFKDDFADYAQLNQEDILPLRRIKYCGHEFNCPAKIEKYLQSFYSYIGLGAEYDYVTRKYRQNQNIPKNVSNKADRGNHDELKNQ